LTFNYQYSSSKNSMKIKYLASLAAIALLSTGVFIACATPEASKDNAATTTTATKHDPCAAKKADPCAAKSASGASIGGPLAQKLQGKPVVVDVYASWCSKCQNIAPTVSELKKQYDGKVEFVVLDVTDKTTTAAAEATAQELGLSKFLAENKTQTGSITIVDPATGKILAQHRNNTDKMAYTKVLDAALTK
jgi:thiol-disulfide isomerase/thioredoxin